MRKRYRNKTIKEGFSPTVAIFINTLRICLGLYCASVTVYFIYNDVTNPSVEHKSVMIM